MVVNKGIENIFVVFGYVVEVGCIYFEIDVYVISDGVLVVFYDLIFDCVIELGGVIVVMLWYKVK